MLTKSLRSLLALSLIIVAPLSQGTVVEVQTVLGNFQVNLFDKGTPKTVENYLGYVNSGAYFNNVVHRSVPNFIVQAGGFQFNDDFPIDEVVSAAAVINEPKYSNVRGTIAMAKLSSGVNSATNQWFINLKNNSGNLDVQNGGFTVFGQVLGDGMDIVDAIAALNIHNRGGVFSEIPLVNYTTADADAGVEVTGEHLMLITDVVVIDANAETHPEILPTKNTLLNQPSTGGGSSGSGSMGGMIMLLITTLGLRWVKR
ncbi:peptidylprolyl isomerase [Alteromonadaceae bacterium BrNp21-10]|nr:peptidylprolyl isomerase [Alteromonadaceae bacterium BrNp21-10]